MIRKLLFFAVIGVGLYFVLASGQFGGIPSLVILAYLVVRAAPAVGRDLSKVWSVCRGRRKFSSIIYSRGSYM